MYISNNMINRFFFLWSFFIPITSIILIPTLQLSQIGYILAYLSPFIVLFFRKDMRYPYFLDLIIFLVLFFLFTLISQIGNLIYDTSLNGLVLVHENIPIAINFFRYSILAQFLYLFPGILLFLYAKYFYNSSWDRWILISILFFVLYGFYKYFFFIATGTDGDFLTNRVFDESGNLRGYLFQLIGIGGITMQRIQSLSGEPSMYAFTVLPYLIFVIHKKYNPLISILILLSLILTFSTTAYVGLLIYLISLFFFSKVNLKYIIGIVVFIFLCTILYLTLSDYIDEIIQFAILDKSSSQSGLERSSIMIDYINYWSNLNIVNMLFGIGFGYARSTDLFSTWLVDIGFFGLLGFSIFYLWNLQLKRLTFLDIGYNSILIVLFTTAMIAVPEYSYLSFWLFLGIIRNKYNKTNIRG